MLISNLMNQRSSTRSRYKNVSLILQSAVYIGAGINHFVHPEFYLRVIPLFISGYSSQVIVLSGIAEIISGVLIIFPVTRKTGLYAIIGMLIAFIPAHIYLIQTVTCTDDAFCGKAILAWLRLFPGQILLIYWARLHKD